MRALDNHENTAPGSTFSYFMGNSVYFRVTFEHFLEQNFSIFVAQSAEARERRAIDDVFLTPYFPGHEVG